jgi:hypothetical protein
MDESMTEGIEEQQQIAESAEAPQPRAVGSPLPMGNGGRVHPPPSEDEATQAPPAPPLGRSLTSSTAPVQQASTLQRAVNVLRVALPFVQRLLPLLDGNIGTAVSNILNPPPPPTPPPPPAPEVDLAPLEAGLAELKTQHRDLHDQVAEQNSSLKRVEDQLEMVREATDRNTLEQQELLEDLKAVGGKVNLVAIIALGLLAISILLNVALYLHIQRVLP